MDPERRALYERLVRLKRMIPEGLLLRLDPYNVMADRFIESAGRATQAGAIVLDAGAGECRHAESFAHARYLGTDSRAGATEQWDYSALSFISNLKAVPLRAASSDVVVSVNVLEHVSDPTRVIAECARVLRPGGRLFLVAPQSWRVHQAPEDYFRYTRHGLSHLLEAADFEIESLEPVGGTFWNFGTRSLYLLTHFRGPWIPLGLLVAPLVGFAIPLLCYYLDRLDRNREDTLGYHVVARLRELPTR